MIKLTDAERLKRLNGKASLHIIDLLILWYPKGRRGVKQLLIDLARKRHKLTWFDAWLMDTEGTSPSNFRSK